MKTKNNIKLKFDEREQVVIGWNLWKVSENTGFNLDKLILND